MVIWNFGAICSALGFDRPKRAKNPQGFCEAPMPAASPARNFFGWAEEIQQRRLI
jgi:hypothetical protein